VSVDSTCSGRFSVSKSYDNNHTLDAKVSKTSFAAFRHLARYGVSMRPWIEKHSGKLCGKSARRAAMRGLKALLRLSASGSQPRRPRPPRGRELRKPGPRPRKLRSWIVDNLVSFPFFDVLYALPLRPDFRWPHGQSKDNRFASSQPVLRLASGSVVDDGRCVLQRACIQPRFHHRQAQNAYAAGNLKRI
jgi:hypothetical protein